MTHRHTVLELHRGVTVLSGPVDLHIGNQRTPIFLLDQSGSQAAGFFAASTEADYLLAMQQALKERAAQAQKDRKRLQELLARIEKDLTAYDALPEVARAVEEAEGLYRRIEALRRIEEFLAVHPAAAQRLEELATAYFGDILKEIETNLVGLRFIALSQLAEKDHRRFLVLDEQDCWLRPDLVPHLMGIVHTIAHKLGFQVLVISHHNIDLFREHADRIYMVKPATGPEPAVIVERFDPPPPRSDDERY